MDDVHDYLMCMVNRDIVLIIFQCKHVQTLLIKLYNKNVLALYFHSLFHIVYTVLQMPK